MLNSKREKAMLGKDAILHFFERKGTKNLFHLPGIHTLPLRESMARRNIRIITGRHESSLAYMADGYARTTDNVAVLIVTPGPGLGNVVSGCMEAYANDVPLFILHIDTGREDIGKGILHELAEPERMFARFTKATYVVSRKEDLVNVLEKGYHAAVSGRRGPVVVSIPYRFLEKEAPFFGEDYSEEQGRLDMDGIGEVLRGKSRPVIIGGGSLMKEDLRPRLEDMCNGCGIPFLTTTAGKGILPENGAWAFGNIMQKGIVKEIIASSDLVIALGTRLRAMDSRLRGVKIKNLVHLDVDRTWIGKNYRAAASASGDMGTCVESLSGLLKGARFEWDLEDLRRAEEKERRLLESSSSGYRIMKLIRDAIPPETVTVWDLNLIAYWAEYYFPVIHQRTFIMPGGTSPIFFGLPAAIGAKLARPDRPCLCVSGDGGFLPCAAELATITQYAIPLVILVYNNMSYGVLEDYMSASYGIEGSMALTNPDFVKLARSFGIKAKKAATLDRLKRIFAEDVRWDEPFLIEFDYPPVPPPWRFVPP